MRGMDPKSGNRKVMEDREIPYHHDLGKGIVHPNPCEGDADDDVESKGMVYSNATLRVVSPPCTTMHDSSSFVESSDG